MALLLLEKPAKVGDTGKITGMHVGTVAVLFTPDFAPLKGRRLTLRREAFLECVTLEESPAGLQRFVEAINAGAELSATTNETIPCKKCGGLGFTRESHRRASWSTSVSRAPTAPAPASRSSRSRRSSSPDRDNPYPALAHGLFRRHIAACPPRCTSA
jgi:hypothetical protein